MSLSVNATRMPDDLPPLAASLAKKHGVLLASLPPVLAASLLMEVSNYDWMFPSERRELEEQLRYLSGSSNAETQRIVESFRSLPLPSGTAMAWSDPKAFLQSFTSHLWRVNATEQFRQCGEAYGVVLDAIRREIACSVARLVIVFVGQGASRAQIPLFAQLRKHGTHFTQVDIKHALAEARAMLQERADAAPESYAHWWIDGSLVNAPSSSAFSQLSYSELQPVREALAKCVRNAMAHDDMGPEKVRSYMMALQPADLSGFPKGQDAVMKHFMVRVLCDGSGTQSLSTSFVQWSAREVLRRSQPTTMIVRFAPRAREVDFLDSSSQRGELDAEGALVDADMGAYYTWLNLRRLQSAEPARFVAIAENGEGAVAIGPGMPAGTATETLATLRKIIDWMSSS